MNEQPDDPEAHIRGLMSDVLTPDGVNVWMTSENTLLGRRTPLQMIHDGEHEEVERVAHMLRDGNFG